MKVKKNLIILIGFILLIIAIGMIFSLEKNKSEKNSLVAITHRNEYQMEEKIIVNIENKFKKRVCFSSCAPYTLENKENNWKDYFDPSYCTESNINKFCLEPLQVKAYEIDLRAVPDLKKGIHRIGLSVCIDCKGNESFREDKRFYSNEFSIK